MTKHNILCTLCLFSVFFASCSTRLSEAERTSIKSVSILTPKISPKSYVDPNGGSSIPSAGLSEVGGYVGAASDGFSGLIIGESIGALAGLGISSIQNSLFKSNNKENFATLKDGIPKDLAGDIHREIVKQIQSNSFFSDKIKSKSNYQFHTKIHKVGLKRVSSKNGKVLLAPIIFGNVSLIGNCETPINITVTGTASSTAGRTVEEYLAQPSLLEQDYLLAAEEFGRDLRSEINKKTR